MEVTASGSVRKGDLHLHDGLARHRYGATGDLADVVDERGAEGVVVGELGHQLVRPTYTVPSGPILFSWVHPSLRCALTLGLASFFQ
jgi:hypothetical protein